MTNKITFFLLFLSLFVSLTGCGKGFFKKVDMRERPVNAQERARQNVEEGKGVSINKILNRRGNTNFQFSSSNPLWRAALDTIDFMPLASANYSGGIIITDWYSSENSNESIKVSLRFLTNEVRSDALNIKVFYKKCALNESCAISEKTGKLVNELNKKILQKAK